MRLQSVYTDTSVFGGVFDDEFTTASREFFDLVQRGRFELMVSDISRKEIASHRSSAALLRRNAAFVADSAGR